MVPQQPDLFHRSIRDNITLGANIQKRSLLMLPKNPAALSLSIICLNALTQWWASEA